MEYTDEQVKEANQRLVNETWKHLSTTGRISTNGEGTCVYSGSGCAFSPAIKKEFHKIADGTEKYKEKHLGIMNADRVINEHPEFLNDWAKPCNPIFAKCIQQAHDTVRGPKDEFLDMLKRNLTVICEHEKLTLPWGTD